MKLLPCPFCGGEPEEDGGMFFEFYGHERQDYSIACKKCRAEVRCDVGEHEGADAPCSCHHDTRKICAEKWNRRAAMLQDAEPASNRDELPLDYLQGHKDGLEWAAQLAEANHPQTGDWLYDDPIDLARAIRKGPDMPTAQAGNHTEQHLDMVDHSGDANKMVAGNSPLVPDGWVACSERMPEEGSKVIVFRPRASESNDPTVKTATYKGGREYYHGFDCYCEPTHWMPLPAAPQQEA